MIIFLTQVGVQFIQADSPNFPRQSKNFVTTHMWASSGVPVFGMLRLVRFACTSRQVQCHLFANEAMKRANQLSHFWHMYSAASTNCMLCIADL
jgi:hypothetical protein